MRTGRRNRRCIRLAAALFGFLVDTPVARCVGSDDIFIRRYSFAFNELHSDFSGKRVLGRIRTDSQNLVPPGCYPCSPSCRHSEMVNPRRGIPSMDCGWKGRAPFKLPRPSLSIHSDRGGATRRCNERIGQPAIFGFREKRIATRKEDKESATKGIATARKGIATEGQRIDREAENLATTISGTTEAGRGLVPSTYLCRQRMEGVLNDKRRDSRPHRCVRLFHAIQVPGWSR
jgi:hypothetical protein